jgi:transcriptional regulator with PAS, ATPase and Fis domain
LPKELTGAQEEMDSSVPIKEETPFKKAEAEVIEKILKKYDGNRIKTAQELGIDRTTLWRKIKKYGLN